MKPTAANPWLADPADTARCAPLVADLRADVVVLGAGYTGLSTALSLRESGVDVVVLERDYAGAGASGRNSGHLTTTVGAPAKALVRSLGEDGARAFFRFCDDAVVYAEARMQEFGIDADYTASGNMSASIHSDHDARCRDETAARRALGARVSFLTSEELRARGIPAAFRCAMLQEPGGILDPGRYVRGLYDAALRAGVRVFEGSHVLRVEDGRPLRTVTEGGVVTADAAVLATNAYTPGLGRLVRAAIPLRVCSIETVPLTPAEREAIAWTGREGVSTSHAIPESYRWTPRGGVAAGTRTVRYAWKSSTRDDEAADAAQFAALEKGLRARFPMLAATRLAARWGGWISFTTDTLPVLGATGSHGNVFYALGYSGHGVAQATLAGKLLAERVRGRHHELSAPLARKVWSWPAEPFRYVGARAVLGTLTALDARLDRKIDDARASTKP